MTPANDAPDNPSRRRALQTAGGGLAIAFLWLNAGPAKAMISARRQPGDAAAAMADGNPAFAPNAFIRIDSNGAVRLVIPSVEMGQSIYTGFAMLLAEELEVGLDQVKVEHAPPSTELYGMPLVGGQLTGGSTSTRSGWQVLREAGAVARTLLVSVAAARWKVPAAECSVVRGVITHGPTGRHTGYGDVASAAAALPMPGAVTLKTPVEFSLIGKPVRRVDAAGKVDGSLPFGIDVKVPGMKVATVQASPVFGGRLLRVDDSRARMVPGFVAVLRLDDAVAVVGEHFWAARKGMEALDIEWDNGPNAHLTTDALFAMLESAVGRVAPIVGRKAGLRPATGQTVSATYRLPMLAHATMEPLNATVHVTSDRCEIWAGSQVPVRCVDAAVAITGLTADEVVFHPQYLGGGFGRRLEHDYVEQAIHFAKQVPYPLQVIWTREEDIRQDIVRPPYLDRVEAVLDDSGLPVWFADRTTGPSVLARFMPAALTKDGLDGDIVECAAETPYDLPNVLVDWVRQDMPAGMRIGWWRGVGPLHNLYVVEGFIDELAHAVGQDPVSYRRRLLHKNPRTRAVLDLAAEKAGWGRKQAPGQGMGVAVGEPFGSHVAAVVEAAVGPDGLVRLSRVIVAVDCGIAINESSVEAQIQGGVLFGLSAALFSRVTVKDGAVEQSNFHDYRVLRINEVPVVEVHRVVSTESPGGLGELGTAIIAPALFNAVFAATGVRLRELPVDPAKLVTGVRPATTGPSGDHG